MKVLLGADLGTSAYKVVALTPDGRVVASSRTATIYRRPAANHVQFSAAAQFQRLCALIRQVAAKLPSTMQPAALALAGANGSTVLLDENRQPLAPAISWLDTRAGADYEKLLPALTRDEVFETVGWRWTPRFPLTQLAWLRAHRPALYRKARYVTIETGYYHSELTGRLAIDASSATTLFLRDQKRRAWHEPFLRALDLDATALPDVVSPGFRLGELTRDAAALTGLPSGLPVVAGSFDHPSAAVASAVLEVGDLLLSCGTSWVGFVPFADRGAALAAGLIVDPFLQPSGPWGAMFALTAIGTTIDRYLTSVFPLPKSLSLAKRYERFTAAAAAVRAGEEGPPIDPLAPVPSDPVAVAALCGDASLGQLSRRLMVGTALTVRRRLAMLATNGVNPRRVVIVGGPSGNSTWTQIVADVLGHELYCGRASMAGAAGAALWAGVGAGVFGTVAEAVRPTQPTGSVITPEPAVHAVYAGLA